jgi:hypothetical protein
MDQLAESFDRDALAPDFDLKPIRKSVAGFIESLQKHYRRVRTRNAHQKTWAHPPRKLLGLYIE